MKETTIMHYLDETHIFLFLVQFGLLLGLAKVVGEPFRRAKQPTLTAEILVGIVLGPTVLGRLFPGIFQGLFPADAVQQNMLETVAWIGVLFLLLESGLEMDFSVAWRKRGSAMVIALADIIIPMAIAFVPCLFIPADFLVAGNTRWVFALFMATVMTISAMPVAAKVLQEMRLLKSEMGYVTMAALAVNDIIGWVLSTIVLALFTQTTVSASFVVTILVSTIGFTAAALILGRPLSTMAVDYFQRKRMPEPASSLTFICLLGLFFGALTQKLGIHALFDFFIAGIVGGEAKNLSEESRRVISQMVHAVFVPIFFVNVGLKIDFLSHFNVGLVVLVTFIGIVGRFVGAWVGVGLTGQFRESRHAIAVAHTPGGMMEIVVAFLALEAGLITHPVFIAIVFGAVFSSALMGPWLAWAVRRHRQVGIDQYLSEHAVLADSHAHTREDLIRELVRLAVKRNKKLNFHSILEAIMDREVVFGTALGDGVAVPHMRVKALQAPMILLGRSVTGVPWNAPDGRPVHFVFLVLVPRAQDALHLQILSAIARIVGNKENRVALLQALDATRLHQLLCEYFSSSDTSTRTPVPG
jgi:Kef-type K+ transport system membrane component KefB